MSTALSMALYLPLLFVASRAFPYTGLSLDLFWRAGFPYFVALPLSWKAASRFAPDPLPVLPRRKVA